MCSYALGALPVSIDLLIDALWNRTNYKLFRMFAPPVAIALTHGTCTS